MLTNMTFGWYAECKGQAQAIATNTENFAQTLQGVFTQQLSTQQSQLQALNTQLNNMITNPQGYSASGLAAMETAATTQNATNYANAQQSLNNQIQTMQGGNAGLPSGAAAMLEGQLQSSAANQQSQSQLGIAQANANVMLQQQSQGLSMLPGEIQAQGQLPGSASSVLTAQNNAFNQQNAIVSPWMKLLQTAVGAAVGGFTGGLGNTLGSSIFGGGSSGGPSVSSLYGLAGGNGSGIGVPFAPNAGVPGQAPDLAGSNPFAPAGGSPLGLPTGSGLSALGGTGA